MFSTFRALRHHNFALLISGQNLSWFTLLPLGFAITGWLIDRVDVAILFVAAGSVAMILSLLPLLNPAIRKLD